MTTPNPANIQNQQARDFSAIRLALASPEQIERWSHGEVTKPETINYRTQKPEKDGLFDERIFGPTKDWECYCGKYKKIRYKGIVCDKCGVEVTRSSVRRERMAHIKLASPVVQIWYLRGTFSRLGLLLGMSIKFLEKVVYFANFIITEVDDQKREATRKELTADYEKEKKDLDARHAAALKEISKTKEGDALAEEEARLKQEQADAFEVLQSGYDLAMDELDTLEPMQIITEAKYRELSVKYAGVFTAGVGAEAILEIIKKLDLNQLAKELEAEAKETTGQRRRKALKRLNLVEGFRKAEIDPSWMIITSLPVIPPDLRPMVQLDGGRFAASDLNDLYRRVINRNNRLKKLMKLRAPEVIQRNEKRMLQEAVDALIDNSARRGRAVSSIGNRRRLKSLSDMLKGKQGRFRQNLLGKRVDYSGRSVIVGGANLKLDQCGLPKRMALELFKPFVIGKLLINGFSHNVKSASKIIDRALQGAAEPAVWDMLEEVIKNHYVLLNRAPTLHRLGIQAFRPILIEGKAIKIHPLVCAAFNADFDGDQMAVHVPLSIKAQEEARLLMNAKYNLLKPAAGEPVVAPTLEIVLGCFYLTNLREGALGEGKAFADSDEAVKAYHNRDVHFQAKVKVRLPKEGVVETSVGRILFNRILPPNIPFQNHTMDKKALRALVAVAYDSCGREETAEMVDQLKDLGFEYATRSGITISSADLTIPAAKDQIIAKTEQQAAAIQDQYENGLISENERYVKTVELWDGVKAEISKVMLEAQDPQNPVYQTVISGARGDTSQLNQMAGMVGLVANPAGRIIELPITSNYKEGLSALEYFISTHGARKGLTDKGLRTPDAGYLARRLVDVAQDTVITVPDCKTKHGLTFRRDEQEAVGRQLADRLAGRVLLKDAKDAKGKVLAKKGTLLDKVELEKLLKGKPEEVTVRSVLTCTQDWGTCQQCYGIDLALNELVNIGEAVGVIAAQSIGEPGTQLTMRTFHTGGVAAEDITQGLPRVEELFEARPPKGEAPLAEIGGRVNIEQTEDKTTITVADGKLSTHDITLPDGYKAKAKSGKAVSAGDELAVHPTKKPLAAPADGTVTVHRGRISLEAFQGELKEYAVPGYYKLRVKNGQEITKGTQLTDGTLNLHDLLAISGKQATWDYIISEVQQIYASQAQHIADKHVEIVVKQMLARVRVLESGDTNLIPSEIVAEDRVQAANQQAKADGKAPATFEPLILGITRASLSTDSFLSAASFQETTKVLIDAALTGQQDELRGLKENVIIGKLIPAGTGMNDEYLYSKVSREEAGPPLAERATASVAVAAPPVIPAAPDEALESVDAAAIEEALDADEVAAEIDDQSLEEDDQ